ncbi:MAG: argininosuccinate lyase, partial [Chloroflexota bacterium]
IAATRRALKGFRAAILGLAERNDNVVMAGYTHLQQAQPVLFAHHMLAYFEMLGRDDERLEDCGRRLDIMPLGSGALAGAPHPLDREWVASQLGFSRVSTNSMDAVADRDFVAEFISCASILMMHVSRLAEELILWSSTEFGFITIGDGFTTGSSLMPQKRNPDVAELARGKTGRVYGHLMAILTTLKALPLTYNRDLQEDKAYLFDTVDTVKATLAVCADMVASVQLMPERMRGSIQDYVLATDIADYLVRRGMPFREAHGISARVSAYARKEGKRLAELTLEEYQRFSARFEDDILGLTVEESVAARTVTGGTAPSRVANALKEARRSLDPA